MRFFEICINVPLNTNAEKKSSILNKYLLDKPTFYSTVHVDAWLCKEIISCDYINSCFDMLN